MLKIAIFLLYLFPLACSAKGFCDYNGTNQLAWNYRFSSAVHKFFGNTKDTLYWKNGLIADQAIAGLMGPPSGIWLLSHDLVIASACRAHSCLERAAVVIACPSTIVAVAILHFDWDRAGWLHHPIVTVFFSKKNKLRRGQSALMAWGNAQASQEGGVASFEYRTQSNTPLRGTRPVSIKILDRGQR